MAQDFIDNFLEYTEHSPSPYIFRLWSAISGVASALERRVWVRIIAQPTYANLYVMLVAAPGIGKSVIDEITHIWRKVPRLHIAPDSVTSASLLDSLMDADRKVVANGSIAFEYHSLIVPAEEFGVFLPSHDYEFLHRLNRIFVNPPAIRVRRKYLKEEIQITNPQLNIIGGTQPSYLGALPEEAWSQGFTQRLLLIYAASGPQVALFANHASREELEHRLVRSIEMLSVMHGQLQWEPKAAEALSTWHNNGGEPRPDHPRLAYYVNRRTQFLAKLMLISCASRLQGDAINIFDYERALTWLLAAEERMPDAFRDMVQKSDANVISELMRFTWQLYVKGKAKPIHEARLHAFLSERVPSEKVPHILALAIRSGFLLNEPEGGKYYKPRAKDELQ